MKAKSKRTLKPKLRFPEFRNKPGWQEKVVSAISDVNPSHEGLPDSFVYIDLESVEQGKLVSRNVIKREGAPSRAQRLLRQRDVIYQTVRPYQRNNFFFNIEDGRDYVASTGYAQLRAHASPAFLFQLLHTEDFVNRVLAKCTGSNYPAINSSDLADIEVAVPSTVEQKKIADCLSSLDGLIEAEGRKLAALRDHKLGLMQQLFPEAGQSQPRLRFPEFRGKGGWEFRELTDFITERNQYPTEKVSLFSLTIEDGVTPKTERYERSFLVNDETNAYKLMLPNDFAFNPMNLRFGAIGRHTGTEKVAVSKYYNIFTCDTTVDSRFCEMYFRSNGMIAFYDNMAIGSLIEKRRVHFAAFLKFDIPFPCLLEQQRIADCLSSLDDEIDAQAAKIDALKQHKRGLMQQLFPASEEM